MWQLLREIRDEIKAELRPLFVKRTRGAWIVVGIGLLIYLSDKFDTANSLFGKMSRMGPALEWTIDAVQYPPVAISLIVVGLIWVGIACYLAAPKELVMTEKQLRDLQKRNQQALLRDQFDPNKAFEIDALAVSDLQNQTEQGQDLRGTPGWCMDCVISIHNRHPTQGLGDVTFRIIDITPPMKAAPSHHPRTQDATLRRVKFGFTDLPAPNVLAGDQTGHIKIFQASKQIMFSEAIKNPPGKSRFTILQFEGVWPEGVKTIFAPEGDYLLAVEVAGSGVGRKEEHFALSFPAEINKPVFWIRKVDPTCEQAKKCFRATAALLNSINIPSFHAFWKRGAGQLPSSESIAEACRLLIANSHEDPFAGLEEYIPAKDYYAFFDFLKHDASNAGMDFGEGNSYLQAAERWHDKQQYSKPSGDARLRMTVRKVGIC